MLLSARHAVEEGRSVASVMEGMRGLHFRRKPLVERQLQRWNAGSSEGSAIASIQDGMLQTRRLAALADVTARARQLLAPRAREAHRR